MLLAEALVMLLHPTLMLSGALAILTLMQPHARFHDVSAGGNFDERSTASDVDVIKCISHFTLMKTQVELLMLALMEFLMKPLMILTLAMSLRFLLVLLRAMFSQRSFSLCFSPKRFVFETQHENRLQYL